MNYLHHVPYVAFEKLANIVQDFECHILLPVRFIAQALGLEIDWNEATSQVTLSDGTTQLAFAIGELTPGMDVPDQLMDGRTMVPLRYIAEALDSTVNWDGATGQIEIIR